MSVRIISTAPRLWLLAVLLVVLTFSSWAQTTPAPATPASAAAPASAASAAGKKRTFDVDLVALNGKDNGATLGLSYTLDWSRTNNGKQLFPPSTGSSFTAEDVKNAVYLWTFVQVLGQGTVAASSDLNPNKFLDLAVTSGAEISTFSAYYRVGAALKGEADQSWDNRQHFYGLSAQATRQGLMFSSGIGTLIVNFGRVDPGKDDKRKALVGNLDPFSRWDAEATYSMKLANPNETADSPIILKPRYLALSYRHYQETGAPSAIKASGKDRNRLGKIRIGLDKDMFIQYARGSLPFDKKSDRSVTVGLTMSLGDKTH